MKTLKILLAMLTIGIIAMSTGLAHEGQEHAAGNGLFGFPPEYIHVLLNPLPGYGMAMGILALGAALFVKNRTAQAIGLCLVILSAAAVWPTVHYGTNAYKGIRGQADEPGQHSLDEHMERAEKGVYVFYATALLGVVALVSRKKFPRAATPLASVTLLFGVASLGTGAWIAKAGGQIRHPEFRADSAASTNSESHEHGASEQSHEKMQHAEESSGHKHGEAASEHHAEKTPMPDTLEGVWKAIHEHHGELASSVNANQFKDIPSHAAMISDLAKKLVEVAHLDHKPAVETGVSKITHALDELKNSAETGSETVMKTHFKEFETALDELEQQMKKQ